MTYANEKNFWLRLRDFVSTTTVADCCSHEEKEMILSVCDQRIIEMSQERKIIQLKSIPSSCVMHNARGYFHPKTDNEILKAIQTSKRYELPKEWQLNEHTNSNYLGGFLNGVKWRESFDR